MYVLGIETSCDETAASVVKDGKEVLSNAVASSLKFHKKYGGVIPEIAFRMQLEIISAVVDEALLEAGVKLKDIRLICVTDGPGLLGSLLVGISFAKALSLSLGLPLLGVDHLRSHIYANSLNNGLRVSLPFVALIVSGGHTSLFYVRDFDRMELLGATQDDACGEAFDKVAKILGLGYPGGPWIERFAQKGNPHKIKFSCSKTQRPLDFSFSGIKTAVLYYVKKQSTVNSPQTTEKIDHRLLCDVAASFQEAAIAVLIRNSLLACRMKRVRTLVIGGGVAVNSRLRESFIRECKLNGVECLFPDKGFCMDNAAMVAGLGYRLFKKGKRSDLCLNVKLD